MMRRCGSVANHRTDRPPVAPPRWVRTVIGMLAFSLLSRCLFAASSAAPEADIAAVFQVAPHDSNRVFADEFDHHTSASGIDSLGTWLAPSWKLPPVVSNGGAAPLTEFVEAPPEPSPFSTLEFESLVFDPSIGRDVEEIAATEPDPSGWMQIKSDYANFYSPWTLKRLGIGVALAAVIANTGVDEHFLRDIYQDNITFAASDELFETLHQPEALGNGFYTLPVFALAALSKPILAPLPGGELPAEWGQRSLRTFLVGAPPMLTLQYLTGGSRPGENAWNSHWRPLEDSNGVSGHAFMGAIPFLSAAGMTDNRWLKCGLVVASTLPAISRMNDDRHFGSQVALGWWMAYLASNAVNSTNIASNRPKLVPWATADSSGLAVEIHW